MTPRKTVTSILKQIEVRFPGIEKAKDRPKYHLHINGVVEELNERIALAERDISLPAAYGHKGRSFLVTETDTRIRLDRTQTKELFKEGVCQKRGEDLFNWMLNNVPHGIFRAFGEKWDEHQEKIKASQINEEAENVTERNIR